METKVVAGIHLPATDVHFAETLPMQSRIANRATYQYPKYEAARKLLPLDRRRTALDVGAHVGLWSRVMTYDFNRVHAFEPIPEHCECWRMNQDRPEKASLHQLAVGNMTCRVNMRVEYGNSGNTRVDFNHSGQHMADMIRLDDWCRDNNVGNIDFIKIDVEGYELAVVLGAEQIIKHWQPIVLVEQKAGNAERCGFKTQKVIELMRTWGMSQMFCKSGDYCMKFIGPVRGRA